MRAKYAVAMMAVTIAGATHSSTTDTYTYDARGRLNAVCATTPNTAHMTIYALDKTDNRTNLTTRNQVIHIHAGSGIHSADGRFYLTMQTDGNFVLYGPSGYLWQSGTHGTAANIAAFQRDGNLVLYTASGGVVWAAGINSYCARLAVQDDGNVVIYAMNGAPVWATNTSGH